MKLDMQLKKEIALNKVLKKQRAELRKMGRAQDVRKKEMAKISKVASENMHDPIFIQPIPSQLPLSHTIQESSQPAPQHDSSQNTIAIPLIHSLENNHPEIDYSVSGMIREDAIDTISL